MNTVEIDLLRKVLTYDPLTGVFVWLPRPGCARNDRAGLVAGGLRKDGYLGLMVLRKPLLAHRVAWAFVNGAWPQRQIDHINRNRADNRISNLREVSPSENCQNSSFYRNNTSGAKGVSWHSCGKWQVNIRVNNKNLYLGLFDRFEDAVNVRLVAQMAHHTCPGET